MKKHLETERAHNQTAWRDWTHYITISNPNWIEVEEWCACYIGDFARDWYKLGMDPAAGVIDGKTRTTWCFKNPGNATLFALRWA
jgi:hypothetical protein